MIKTKIFNFIRKLLFKNLICENIIVFFNSYKICSFLFHRLPPNYYQYSFPTWRYVYRNNLKFRLDISQYMEWAFYYNIPIEPRDIIYNYCNGTQGIIIDIGANFGEIAITLSKLNPSSFVIAFEPGKLSYEKLVYNKNINKLNNISVYPYAIGDINKEINFEECPNAQHGSHISIIQNNKQYKVKQITLDSFFQENNYQDKIKFIKIDTEGYELFVLRGAKNILLKHFPVIYFECNNDLFNFFNYKINDIIKFLEKIGYNSFIIAQNLQKFDPYSNLQLNHFDLIAQKL